MALPPRRASVALQLLVVALAFAAVVFSSADAARAPAALEAQAPTSDSDAMPVEHVVVVDKRGGGGGYGGGGGGGHGGGEGGGSVGGGSKGWGFGGGGAGYHGRGHKSAAPSGRHGVWKVGVAASVLGAAAWLL